MAFNFVKSAIAETSLSPIMVDREKMETEEVVGRELTVVEFGFGPKFDKQGARVVDPVTGEVDVFGVIVFKEEPGKFYCVGTVFTNICKAWAAAFGGDHEAASNELRASGGVRVRFTASRTKTGNNLVKVEVLG